MSILRVDNITKRFTTRSGSVQALDGVSLAIEAGETFGLVGESGSGKTTLGKIVLGIIRPDSGSVEVCAKKMQVIFQDPQNSLDPRMRVGEIVGEGLTLHYFGVRPLLVKCFRKRGQTPFADYGKMVEEALEMVRLPKDALEKYPHEFSGGERQRIAIARAIVTKPGFIVCDEPVSSLDVTIQLQILNLLKDIQKKLSITYLFISHDLRVVKFMCGRVAVMKSGRVVESGHVSQLYKAPQHEYTEKLLSSILRIA